LTSPDRRQRIEAICDAALDHDVVERYAFVAKACDGDETLRREVEALLAHAQTAAGFLVTPVDAVVAQVMAADSGVSLVGHQFGTYRILSRLGAGGMGEVYRARDSKLGRDVAIKVLPAAFTADPDRLARFEREARLLAALNQPHIGAIYGLEDVDGVSALVLELVEGETLSERLARGPVPVIEALAIARQIAEALEAAHEKGIVHRDLKPANIKITPSGVVKVLDFGLAKASARESGGAGAAPTHSPTLMVSGTQEGVLLGTAAYMSPEQARGKGVDRRADIWALGCVLYEMLTGDGAFEGETASDYIAAILDRDPDWTALPSAMPPGVGRLLRRCLEKDPERRWHDVADVGIEIDETTAAPPVALRTSLAKTRRAWLVLSGVAGIGALVIVGLVGWVSWQATPRSAPIRLVAELGADVSLVTEASSAGGAAAVLSPDGQVLAFVGQDRGGGSQLYLRPLEAIQATPLPGTEGARDPFFSPDGQWIGFVADGKVKKIAAAGGAVVALADAPDARGGTWAEDGSVVFTPGGAGGANLLRVSSAGGKPEVFTTHGTGEVTQRWPQFLPGGKGVLYTSHTRIGEYGDADLIVQPLPTGSRKIVQRGGYYGRYLTSGHLVFVRDGTLFATPFDLDRLAAVGPTVPVVERVTSRPNTGGAQFAASRNGTLVYLASLSDEAPFEWMTRDGRTTALRATPSNWSNVNISPDGHRLAFDIYNGTQSDVWIFDWADGTLTRLTFDRGASHPVWTPDGSRIVFALQRPDSPTRARNLYWRRADGTGVVQRLTESLNDQIPGSWHPSGKFLAFTEGRESSDILILSIDGSEDAGWTPGIPTVFLDSPAHELGPAFSPDGRWLAYTLNDSGRNQLYVRPFPGPGGNWLISVAGPTIGISPVWSRARPELFFATPDSHIMASAYSVEGAAFRAGPPRLWADARFGRRGEAGSRSFDLHPDGERIVVAPYPEQLKQDRLIFVFNFFDELRRMAPAKR
jgi:Tol biopolymer transport system component